MCIRQVLFVLIVMMISLATTSFAQRPTQGTMTNCRVISPYNPGTFSCECYQNRRDMPRGMFCIVLPTLDSLVPVEPRRMRMWMRMQMDSMPHNPRLMLRDSIK